MLLRTAPCRSYSRKPLRFPRPDPSGRNEPVVSGIVDFLSDAAFAAKKKILTAAFKVENAAVGSVQRLLSGVPDTLGSMLERFIAILTLVTVLGPGVVGAYAMRAAPEGVVETGAPSFVVLGPEALGLSSVPNEIHLLPDGRILVVSQHEIAFGDGVRWEAYRAAGGPSSILRSVAVDNDGQIYTGVEGGMSRLDLCEGGLWRLALAVKLPPEDASQRAALVSVATFPDHWYWYGGSGAIVSWRPGESARVVSDPGAHVGAVERIFTLGRDVFVSDQSSGGLFRLNGNGTLELMNASDLLVSERVTCTVPFDADQLLVGTGSVGLKLFDGKQFRPFGASGTLSSGHRITDLCSAGDGYFAASVDTVGIVFFDRQGRIVQELERSLDHRLARAQRLQYSREGVLWALLNDGIARVEFPSPISHYDPMLAGGLAFAQPIRHEDRLWIETDGQAMRAVYDEGKRLVRFVDDTPPGRYLFTMAEENGQLFATNEEGIYVLEAEGWKLALPGIVNARIALAGSTRKELYYVARGEYGTIEQSPSGFKARRIPFRELGDSYNSMVDSEGVVWLEFGLSRIGRLDTSVSQPALQILGTDNGLLNGWVEEFLIDGTARFHVSNHLFRFAHAQNGFVEDRELLAQIPELAGAGGRPIADGVGHLWYTANGAAHAIDRNASGGMREIKMPPVGFAPTGYTVEDDGKVWMFENRHLARIDLQQHSPPEVPIQALITSVDFPASQRQIFGPGAAIKPLDYLDNSPIFHFSAPANPFTSPITFEVLLEGAGTQWVSMGGAGSATFNRLKEGDYVFRVRPVSGGIVRGKESLLRFTVRPPWFRTTWAWVIYGAATLGLFALVMWLSSYLQRRENERLEQLVAIRTRELETTNAQLARQIKETTEKSAALAESEESYRALNGKLEERVEERTAELSRSNKELQQRELLFRLIFEHAPVGISWKRTELGNVHHINPTFRRILELPADTLTNETHFALLVHPADAPRQSEKNQLIATGKIDRYTLEERFVLPGGRLVWGLLSVAVIRGEVDEIIQEIGILEDITSRKHSEDELASAHKELVDASRKAGMAEVATGVLHNVGNVLNSVNVSATVIADQLRQSKVANVGKLAGLFEKHKGDLSGFLTKDPGGLMVPGYLASLSESLFSERATLNTELEELRKNIEHIKEIVSMQQSFARTSGVIESSSMTDIVEDVLRLNGGTLAHHDIDIVRDYEVQPVIATDKHRVMQILVNLVRNAKHACDDSARNDKKITIRVTSRHKSIFISVIDNGVGIPPENLQRIFNHGFTTRKNGHGFGLHSGALAARELGGSLNVESAGTGLGATFVLELPQMPGGINNINAA
jgi:PAS domain S-box-containing protein